MTDIRTNCHSAGSVWKECAASCVLTGLCMTGAMQKDEKTGIVSNEFNPQKCVGCWMCVMACPFGVISPKQDGDRKIAVKCDMCVKRGSPACVDSCPKGAIVYMEDEEFAEYKRQLSVESSSFRQDGDL